MAKTKQEVFYVKSESDFHLFSTAKKARNYLIGSIDGMGLVDEEDKEIDLDELEKWNESEPDFEVYSPDTGELLFTLSVKTVDNMK